MDFHSNRADNSRCSMLIFHFLARMYAIKIILNVHNYNLWQTYCYNMLKWISNTWILNADYILHSYQILNTLNIEHGTIIIIIIFLPNIEEIVTNGNLLKCAMQWMPTVKQRENNEFGEMAMKTVNLMRWCIDDGWWVGWMMVNKQFLSFFLYHLIHSISKSFG